MMSIHEDDIQKIKEMLQIFHEVAIHSRKGESETVYHNALLYEFQQRSVLFTKEETVPILYKEQFVGIARLDIRIHNWLPSIIELKAVGSNIKPEHVWQIMRYMHLKNVRYGFIVNYNQTPLKPIEVKVIVVENDITYFYNVETNTLDFVPSNIFT